MKVAVDRTNEKSGFSEYRDGWKDKRQTERMRRALFENIVMIEKKPQTERMSRQVFQNREMIGKKRQTERNDAGWSKMTWGQIIDRVHPEHKQPYTGGKL